MCRLMHRFWTAQEFAFFQLEGLFKSPVEISSKSMLGFSTSHHTSNHCTAHGFVTSSLQFKYPFMEWFVSDF